MQELFLFCVLLVCGSSTVLQPKKNNNYRPHAAIRLRSGDLFKGWQGHLSPEAGLLMDYEIRYGTPRRTHIVRRAATLYDFSDYFKIHVREGDDLVLNVRNEKVPVYLCGENKLKQWGKKTSKHNSFEDCQQLRRFKDGKYEFPKSSSELSVEVARCMVVDGHVQCEAVQAKPCTKRLPKRPRNVLKGRFRKLLKAEDRTLEQEQTVCLRNVFGGEYYIRIQPKAREPHDLASLKMWQYQFNLRVQIR